MNPLISPANPLLATKLNPFDFVNPPEDPKQIAEIMLAHLEEYRGLGLSANQIGLPYRVFVIRTEPRLVCFNPSITWLSDDTSVIEEGCLTYPMLYVKIRRPSKIRAKFFTEEGKMVTRRFDEMIARCYQHELDHLDGVNYLERAKKFHLDRAKRKSKLLMRKKKKFDKLAAGV